MRNSQGCYPLDLACTHCGGSIASSGPVDHFVYYCEDCEIQEGPYFDIKNPTEVLNAGYYTENQEIKSL